MKTGGGYDFARPFVFMFDDPNWVPKILIGGLFVLAAFLIIGIFFILGYAARLTRNVIAGAHHPLPDWDDLGEYFGEGFSLFCVALVYTLPIIILAIVLVVPAALMEAVEDETIRNLGGCAAGTLWCILVPLSFAVMFFLPAALLMAITERRFGAAFEFGRIWSFIKANIGNYLLAVVIYFVARFVGGFGIILLCIGIVFTEFWAIVAYTYAFAEAYRLSGGKR
jgi:hypothetical protein